jgi:hypothetical protein
LCRRTLAIWRVCWDITGGHNWGGGELIKKGV